MPGWKSRPGGSTPRPCFSRFGQRKAAARRAYMRFVEEGLQRGRDPVLAGDEWLEHAREIKRSVRSDVPVSDPIVGSEAFVQEVLAAVDGETGRVALRRSDAVRESRPPLGTLIDLVCAVVGIERVQFDECPKRHGPRLARQLLVRVWVQEYRGSQAELGRHLRTAPSLVSRWYARAIESVHEQNDLYEEVVGRLASVESWSVPETGERIRREGTERKATVNVVLLADET